MNIALIVLSSILVILVIGLIFKKDFREDVLKAGGENSAEFKGVKLKGALFWVIYAVTAMGTIYIAMNGNIDNCIPLLSCKDSTQWIALNLETAQPTVLEYGCDNTVQTENHHDRKVVLDLSLTEDFQVTGNGSKYSLGKINMESLRALHLTNDLDIEKYIEISYDLALNPFKATRNVNRFYDWNEYQNLPFTVMVEYTSERGIHTVINDKNSTALTAPLSLSSKWTKVIVLNEKIYLLRLRSRDTNPDNNEPEHANFQVLQFSGKIIK